MGRLSLGLGLGLASLAALPASALAQDSDGDGVANTSDAFPCDGLRASVTYFPTQTSSALLVYEDQWPGATDLDFNDVALRTHLRLERDAAGNVVQLVAVFDPVAVGGELSNGLGLVLPTSRTGVTARRRLGGGAWQTVTLEGDANATMVLSSNLRELYANAGGRINSRPNEARLTGQRLEVEVSFATPAAISQAAAPFDVFIFRAGNLGHQIHFPQYAGTSAMTGGLFNSGQDGSTATRKFVHLSGVPAALNLLTSTRYPLEGIGISALFPDIAGFASSGGAQNASFFATNVIAAQGHDVAAPTLPTVAAADSSCTLLGSSPATAGATCRSLLIGGAATSGVYWIDPDGAGSDPAYQVYCDQTTDGGGWTVFQRRTNGSVDFFRNFASYQAGFGTPATEYWVGLDRMHRFTTLRASRLRVDMRRNADAAFAAYSSFSIGPPSGFFVLSVSGYSGTAGDGLGYHSGRRFSTFDSGVAWCANDYLGAWWYGECHVSNLNGTWGLTTYAQGPVWDSWLGYYTPMTFTQMAMREN
jgi:LruC domain-containing protein